VAQNSAVDAWVAAVNATAQAIDRGGDGDEARLPALVQGYIMLCQAGPEGFADLCEELESPANQQALRRGERRYWRRRNKQNAV
jgi:hypothetical protein